MSYLKQFFYLNYVLDKKFKVSQLPYSCCFRIQAIFYLPLWNFFPMFNARGVLRTQSTTLTPYLRYSVNYFIKNTLSQTFEWLLNKSVKTFPLPFHYSFLKNIASKSYLFISSSIYIIIIFIAKKLSHSMKSKPPFFLNPLNCTESSCSLSKERCFSRE